MDSDTRWQGTCPLHVPGRLGVQMVAATMRWTMVMEIAKTWAEPGPAITNYQHAVAT